MFAIGFKTASADVNYAIYKPYIGAYYLNGTTSVDWLYLQSQDEHERSLFRGYYEGLVTGNIICKDLNFSRSIFNPDPKILNTDNFDLYFNTWYRYNRTTDSYLLQTGGVEIIGRIVLKNDDGYADARIALKNYIRK